MQICQVLTPNTFTQWIRMSFNATYFSITISKYTFWGKNVPAVDTSQIKYKTEIIFVCSDWLWPTWRRRKYPGVSRPSLMIISADRAPQTSQLSSCREGKTVITSPQVYVYNVRSEDIRRKGHLDTILTPKWTCFCFFF